MPRFLQKLPSLSNVAAGQTATLNLPLGYTFNAIYLEHNIANLAHLANIEVIVNGKTIQTFKDADEVNKLNLYYGRYEQAGVMSLWFERPEMATPFDRQLAGLGTLDIQTLQLKFDINAAAAAPVISATAMVSPNEPMGLITKVKPFFLNSAVSGQVDIDSIVKAGRIAAIHLFKADISACVVEINSRKVYEASKTLGEKTQKDWGRVPQTAVCTHLDFTTNGDIAQGLIMDGGVYDFRVRPTLATSGAVRAVVEYLDGLDGI